MRPPQQERAQKLLQMGVPQEIVDKAMKDETALQKVEQLAGQYLQPKKTLQKAEAAIPVSNIAKAPNDDIEGSLTSMPGLPKNIQDGVRSNPDSLPQIKRLYLEGVKTGQIKIPEESYLADSKAIKSIGLDGEKISQDLSQEFSLGKYALQQLAEGATFGVYDSELEAPDTSSMLVGFGANLIGGAITTGLFLTGLGQLGVLGGTAVKVAKTGAEVKSLKRKLEVAKILSKSDDAVLAAQSAEQIPALAKTVRSAQLTKIGQEATKAAAEGALLGAGVGAAKGVVQGVSDGKVKLEDVLTESIASSVEFAAMGAAFTPLAEVAGNFVTRRQLGKFKGSVERFASTEANQALLKQTSTTDLAKIIEMKKADPDGFMKMIAGSDKAEDIKRAVQGFEAIEKIQLLKPYMSSVELLSNPEALNVLNRAEQSQIAKNIFQNPASPYKMLYDTNNDLRTMVDLGHFGEVFDLLEVEMHNLVGKNKDFSDFVKMPFMNDAASLAEAKALAMTSKKSFMKKGVNVEDLQNVLIKYDLTPTPELKAQAQAGLRKKAFNRFEQGAIKLSSGEVNDLVNNTISKNLQILADGKIRVQDLGIIQDQDAMLKALTTFNAPLGKTLFQAFEINGSSDDWFGRVPAELKDVAEPLIKKRVYKQELGQMYRSLSQKRAALKVAMKEGSAEEVKILKDGIAQAHIKIKARLGMINTINTSLKGTKPNTSLKGTKPNTSLKGTKPEDVARAQELVSTMNIPLRSQTFGKTAQNVDLTLGKGADIEGTQNFMQRFLPYENPVFMKKGSELAEYTHSLLASNQDIGEFNKLSPFNIERKLAAELGTNNPINEVIQNYKQRSRAHKEHYSMLSKKVDELGIKAGSQESKLVEMLGEKKIDVTHEAMTSLNPEMRAKVINASSTLRGMYDEMLVEINKVMNRNQLPEINARADYFHHFRQVQEDLPQMIDKYLSGKADEVAKSGKWIFKPNADLKMTAFSASKLRKGLEGPGDAIAGFKIYANGALDRIYYTDLIRNIDAAKWMAPKNLVSFLQNFKNDYVLRLPDEGRLMSKGWKQAFETARSNQARGALLGKVSTMVQQITSMPLNIGISPKHGLKAIMSMGTKEADEITAQSTNLFMRQIKSEGTEFAPTAYKKYFNELAGGKIKRGLDASEKFMEAGLQGFDRVAVKQGYLTGYYKAKDSGLTHEQAVRFGDYWAGAIQADMTRIGQPEFYQTTIGRAIGQFQSFTINLFASVVNDLPRYANSDGPAEAVSMILKTAAGVSISNEILNEAGIPGAFELDALIPFLGQARFGLPGLPGAIRNTGEYAAYKMAGKEYEAGKKLTEMKSQAVSLTGIPGSGQIYKTGKYLADRDKGDDFSETVNGILFGKSSKFIKQEQKDKKRDAKKGFLRKEIKRFVRKTL